MGGSVGRIKIDSDTPGPMVQPLCVALDYALGQCHAQLLQMAWTNSIFNT